MFMPRAARQRPLRSSQLTTTYSQSAPVCQASKQPQITAINSLGLTALTSDQKAAITPVSQGSFSTARPPDLCVCVHVSQRAHLTTFGGCVHTRVS